MYIFVRHCRLYTLIIFEYYKHLFIMFFQYYFIIFYFKNLFIFIFIEKDCSVNLIFKANLNIFSSISY